jgi:PhnB protein
MQFASLYLNFNGNAEEAFEHYRSIFGGEYEGVLRFRDFGEDAMGAAESELDKIAHISLPLVEGISLMASDVIGAQADDFNAGNNVYIYIEADAAEEADRLFGALSDRGSVEMPLQSTEWAEKYGSCVDRFEVRWMISFTGDVQFSL